MSTVVRRIHEDTIRASLRDPVTIEESYTFIVDQLDGFELQAIQRHSPELLRGQPHPTFRRPVLLSEGIEPEQQNGTRAIRARVRYTSEVPDNPLSQPADIQWDTFTVRELVTHDAEGKLFVNTAGELYDVEMDVDYWGMRVTKNVARLPSWVKAYKGAVNKDAITIDGEDFPKETLAIATLSISGRNVENDQPFRTVSLSILHNPDTWVRRYPNIGWHERKELRTSRPGRRRFKLDPVVTPGSGERATKPQWLDKDGRQLRERVIVDPGPPPFIEEVLSVPPHPTHRLIFNEFWFGRRLPYSRIASLFV